MEATIAIFAAVMAIGAVIELVSQYIKTKNKWFLVALFLGIFIPLIAGTFLMLHVLTLIR
ncbi:MULTISPECIES: hypothetical protein [unclassified Sporolactobacillus]|uniref:hypothetical protein n=1 Tax=unclassified Sporolactobacillus TaxID=2628533 RepID=UPI00236795D2|nr:hypothetical protein [Sporolactobacillus sp. CQH2019]MDD9150426.1 hypothetical protein [Sporolactobacillus sp. CQH2019]